MKRSLIICLIITVSFHLTACGEYQYNDSPPDTSEEISVNITSTSSITEQTINRTLAEAPFVKADPRYDPKLDDKLVELYYAWIRGEEKEYAAYHGLKLREEGVFATIKSQPEQIEAVKAAALKAGATLLTQIGDFQDAFIPPGSLLDLAHEQSVSYIEIPIQEVPD
ncbi:MAG: hypothetical protein JW712_12100 [Dehalococcoidales bacterium]|nr:hypothetical protein [Dehalococcoidales bacterium]